MKIYFLLAIIFLQGCATAPEQVSELGRKYPTKVSKQVEPTPEQLRAWSESETKREQELIKAEKERKDLEAQAKVEVQKQVLLEEKSLPKKVQPTSKQPETVNTTPEVVDKTPPVEATPQEDPVPVKEEPKKNKLQDLLNFGL